MSATHHLARPWDSAPRLRFAVEDACPLEPAAAPTLKFTVAIEAEEDRPVRSILLDVQIQIAARRRGHGPAEQERLLEIFGAPERWATTLRTLPWLRTTLVVPAFTGATTAEMLIPCTYDLEVTAARYLAGLSAGVVPLELLFSGTVFYTTPAGALQATRIAWDEEAEYELPVAVWRATMDRHFPGAAWLRLRGESFDRLCAYKAQHAFETWEATIDSLLGPEVGP